MKIKDGSKMRKRIVTILLTALLVANISSCSYVPEKDIDSKTYAESTKPDTSIALDDTGNILENTNEINADTRPVRKHPEFVNGASGNSNVTYIFNQNGEFSVHITDWDETHLFTSLTANDINAFKYIASAIGVNNERAFLTLKCSQKITIVSVKKGSQSETVTELDVDEAAYKIIGNFIDENVGYLFAFKEASGIHAKGDSKLSNFFKTEDGGNTWDAINVQNAPSTSLSEDVVIAKMITDNVGIISGRYWADDYDFCKRTFLTTDGGMNWVNITELPKVDTFCGAEVADFTLVENFYLLTIRHKISETDYGYAKYKSTDLSTWIQIS